MDPTAAEDGWAREWGALALSVVAYAVLAVMVARRIPLEAGVGDAFITELRPLLKPEPVEHALFLLGLASIPTLPIAFYLALFRLRLASALGLRLRDILLCGGAAIWLTWLCFSSEIPDAPLYLAGAAAIGAVLIAAGRNRRATSLLYAGACAAIVFLGWRTQVIDDSWFLLDIDVWHHFDILLGAVNGVLHGRTVLVDMTSQYGVLWPYVAAALLRPFGLSVASLSGFFATLEALQLVFLYLALARVMGRRSLATLLSFAAVAGVSHALFGSAPFNLEQTLFRRVDYAYEVTPVYYQFFPLRTFWPAFFIWLVPLCAGPRRRLVLVAGYLLCGVALLWNVDQGLVVLIAWTAQLAYERLGDRWRPVLRHVVLHAALAAATAAGSVGAYVLFAHARAGSWPDLSRLVFFQSVFYRFGFGMLPMRLGELWQPLILVYVLTVFACSRRALSGRTRGDAPWKLFIALYGLGLFAYYQGRSSPKVLLAVLFPAVFLSCLEVHEGLEALRGTSLRTLLTDAPRRGIALQTLLWSLWCGYGGINFARTLPEALGGGQPAMEFDPQATEALRRDIGGRPAVMLADPDAFLLVKSGSWSALPVAENQEVFLREQVEEIQRIVDRKDVVVVAHPRLDPLWARHVDLHGLHGVKRPGGFIVLRR
ncbi:MAG: hypothetical protein ABR567_13325 [Myxococcales bacterium]|nr:hypothetical protein [Myxococcales bacterium]